MKHFCFHGNLGCCNAHQWVSLRDLWMFWRRALISAPNQLIGLFKKIFVADRSPDWPFCTRETLLSIPFGNWQFILIYHFRSCIWIFWIHNQRTFPPHLFFFYLNSHCTDNFYSHKCICDRFILSTDFPIFCILYLYYI